MQTLIENQFRTVSGVDVVATYETPGDGRLLVRATLHRDGAPVVRDGKALAGELLPLYPIPADAKASSYYGPMLDMGATHYARFADLTLTFAGADAARLDAAWRDGQQQATEVMKAAAAKRDAELRATREVRRVLYWATGWADYQLTEAAADRGELRIGLSGTSIKISGHCPSLRVIQDRSPGWGFFAGCANILYAVSDEDWAILVTETAEVEGAAVTRRLKADSALQAVVVPAEAVAAYERWDGAAANAWANGAEAAAALINLYGSAIEAQDLGQPPARLDDLPTYPAGA
ncbi:hypothetical protein [Aquabacter cavernae]|uniref:hypothetical protein n=1 Tax=Aquabacter cavernae TaxID=2496029 RepID=UPI000F8CC9F6|nr:hypothetical protein [Aquabacter cavernae]